MTERLGTALMQETNMYLEQRIEKLEQEIQELKVKLFQKEWKESPKPWEKAASDYLYNPSLTMLSEPDLETAFASPWDDSKVYCPQHPVIAQRVSKLTSVTENNIPNPDYYDSSDLPEYYPPYPNILGSWDDQEKNPLDTITVKQPDDSDYEYPGYPNILGSWDEGSRDDVITSWGFASEFDKSDKEFLNYLSSDQEKNPLDVLEESPTSTNFKKAYEEITKARKAYDKELNNHFSSSKH